MTLKNTDKASAKLIRLKFNMLVLTIQDDLVGSYMVIKKKKKKKKKNLLSLCPKNILALNLLKKQQHSFLAEETKMHGLNPKYLAPPPPQKKKK